MTQPRLPWSQTSANRRAAVHTSAGGGGGAAWAAEIERRLLADCHPKQRQFVEDPHRRVSALVGRGGGKTTAWKARALIKLAKIKRAQLRYIALSRPDAEELLWEPLKFTIEELGREIPGLVVGQDVLFNETKLRMTFVATGGVLQLVGADDKKEIGKLRGKPFHEVGLDEAASHDDRKVSDLLYRVVGPRLGDYRGSFVMFGTPGTELFGEFYKATLPGLRVDGQPTHRPYERRNDPEFADWTGWSSHGWALNDPEAQKIPQLANMWAEALITKADQRWSDDNPIWRREYLGEWAADDTENIYRYRAQLRIAVDPERSKELRLIRNDAIREGRVLEAAKIDEELLGSLVQWNQWDPKIDPRTGFAILPEQFKDWLYAYGQDMGSKDPYALNIFAFSPSDPSRTLYHVYCFGKTGMYARLIATVMLGETVVERVLRGEKVDYDKLDSGTFGVTGWPVALVADFAALGEAVADELANVYGIRIKAAEKKGKHSAIEGVNGDLIDGRIKILKGSELERQLSALQWRRDDYGQPKEDKSDRNDHADSFVYLRREIVALFAAGVVVSAPPTAPVYTDPMGLGGEDAGEFDALLGPVEFGDDAWGNQ